MTNKLLLEFLMLKAKQKGEKEKESLDKIYQMVQQLFQQQQEMIRKLQRENANLKAKNTLEIPTSFGKIVASKNDFDTDYPAIFVEVENEDGAAKNVVVVEYMTEEKKVQIHVWNRTQEDPINSYIWDENELVRIFSPKQYV